MTDTTNANQVAIVTGASRGLGRAVAETLSSAGWLVVVDGRDAVALASAVQDIDGVLAVPGDVTDPGHRQALVDAAAKAGKLRLLVNNAGALGPSPQPPVADYPLDVLRDVVEANLLAPWGLTQAALPALRANAGAVVNVTSDAAVEPYEGWGGYAATKAALEHVSAILAAEEQEVRVWWVDPGDMRTAMHQAAFPGEDITDRPLPETIAPAFVRLVEERPRSGRYQAVDLLTREVSS